MYKRQICENPRCANPVSVFRTRYCSERCCKRHTGDVWRRANGWQATVYARKHGATELEQIIPQEVFDRDGWDCQICQGPVDPTLAYPDRLSASLDHIVPITMGGSHTLDNVQCAHLACNCRKGRRTEAPAAATPLEVPSREVTLRESVPLLRPRITLDALRRASHRPGFPPPVRTAMRGAGIYELAALRIWRGRHATNQPTN